MKVTLRELTNYRRSEKCYLIEDGDGDFFVIYGTKYRIVKHGDLYGFILDFVNGTVGWNFVDRRLRFNRDNDYQEGNNHDWSDFNETIKDKVVHVTKLFIDGEKKELDKN